MELQRANSLSGAPLHVADGSVVRTSASENFELLFNVIAVASRAPASIVTATPRTRTRMFITHPLVKHLHGLGLVTLTGREEMIDLDLRLLLISDNSRALEALRARLRYDDCG